MHKSATVINLKKKGSLRQSSVILTRKDVRIKQDLGDGFFRFDFGEVTISPRSFRTIRIQFLPLKIINAGWRVNLFQQAFAIESFPIAPNEWLMTIRNLSSIE